MPAEEPSLPEPLASSAAALEAALPLWWMASSSTLRFLLKHGCLSISQRRESQSQTFTHRLRIAGAWGM